MEEKIDLTQIFAADVSCLESSELYYEAYDSVSDRRREKTDRYLRARDRFTSLGAEVLLYYAVWKRFGVKLKPQIGQRLDGKPFFTDFDLKFNLSHSGSYVLCAVSDKEVGCDIEKCRNADTELARRFFNKSEYEHILSAQTEEEKNILFFRYWTLKESFIKATGIGMRIGLDSFRIVLGDEITVQQNVSNNKFFFREYGSVEGYRCAICSEAEVSGTEIEFVDLRSVLSDRIKH